MLSLGLLWFGLDQTASTELIQSAQLPVLPVEVLQSSALGGGLVELFLGRGVLDLPPGSTVPLHPLAISGFVGLMTNALALLPIGSKFTTFVCKESCDFHGFTAIPAPSFCCPYRHRWRPYLYRHVWTKRWVSSEDFFDSVNVRCGAFWV